MKGYPTLSDFDKEIRPQEIKRLRFRRTQAKVPSGNPGNDAVGLALSGGGIRSATFNLGVLQALERCGFLKHIDYLSTVSGGGYIGSCLTWFMSQNKQPFPFGIRVTDYKKTGGNVLGWLRGHGNYLTPGGALNLWALLGAILAGTLATLTVLVPVFLTAIYGLAHPGLGDNVPWIAGMVASLPSLPYNVPRPDGFALFFSVGLFALAIFVVTALFYAIATSFSFVRTSQFQSWIHAIGGTVLATGVAGVLVGVVPWAHHFIDARMETWKEVAMSGISLSGVLSIVGALRGKKEGGESHGWRSLLLGVGLALVVYGLFLWFYDIVATKRNFPGWLEVLLYFSVLIALLANINHVSMHRFYRNRLMEAYMPEGLANAASGSADLCRLHTIPQTAAPFHVIGTNVQLTGSKTTRYRTRGGDSFFFSPLFSGSSATGFIGTDQYVGGSMNLATAFAISGAAVDTNTYATRSRPLNFLMTLFNVRTGYWIRNPRHPSWFWLGFSRPRWYWYLFREMFGRGLTENTWHIHLSDGGHFENLGLYELVRRRCRHIIVCDAGADPHYRFGDLARAIELIRTDFGVVIDIDVEKIRSHGADRVSPSAFVRGKVYYGDNVTGSILYIKPTLLKDLPEDVKGYASVHATFPHESTADQFFDEPQFEAYRELGYRIGKTLCDRKSGKSIKSLF